MVVISQLVSELTEKIEKLERQFNLYFIGQEKRPPLPALDKLKREVNVLMTASMGSKNLAEQHLATQLLNRFTVYRQKWEKYVTDIEEGRAKPGSHFFGGLGSGGFARSMQQDLEAVQREKDNMAFRMSAMIDETAQKFVEMSKRLANKNYSIESVTEMLEKKIGDIRQKMGDDFTFDVYFEDGKVKIKPKKN
ncbi:hypothetical protein J5834_04520 [bacterium]|nr:hypothetical protein [bacterium]